MTNGTNTNIKSYWSGGDLIFQKRYSGVNPQIEFGVDDDGVDVKFYGATSGAYAEWDESADTFQVLGGAKFTLGASGAGADFTLYGSTAGAYLLWDASDDGLEFTGEARLDFSGATVAAANTDGGVIKAGTSAARVTEDTANMKFVSMYFDNGATSGDNRGIYNRLYLTGAGGGGESLRSYTTIENVAAGTAHGAHISLSVDTSGSVTGQGIGMRGTLELGNAAMTGGTYAATQSELYANGASCDPSGVTKLSFQRYVIDGDTTGVAATEDKAALFELANFTAASGNVVGANTATEDQLNFTNWVPIRIDIGGTTHYLVAAQAIATVAT